jgi:hypothetical protein
MSFLEVKLLMVDVDHPLSSSSMVEYGQGFVSTLVLKLLLLSKSKLQRLVRYAV